MNRSVLLFSAIFNITVSIAQVGINTTNPQAQLEVSGGNVRFSEYGTGAQLGSPSQILGVDTDGDIIELPLTLINDTSGLQFYSWGGLTDNPPSGSPGPDVIDINDITTYVEGGSPPLGPPGRSGVYLGPLNLVNSGLDNFRPIGSLFNYIMVFTGTLIVQNTGSFEFCSDSDDGSRIYIDEALILNDWFNQPVGTNACNSINLAAGRHDVEFWFYERLGAQIIDFTWGANPDGYSGVIQANQFIIE